MSNIAASKNFSVGLSQSLQEGTRQLFRDVQQNTDRLDRKKTNVAQAGVEQINRGNQVSSALSEARSKIDVFA